MKSASRLISTALILSLPFAGFAQADRSVHSSNKNNDHMTTIEQNKTAVRRLYEESLNKGDLSILGEFIAENYVGLRGEKGPEGFASNLTPLIKAFPDIHYEIVELVGEGNKVMINWKWEGTHEQQYAHIPATHKKVVNTALAVYDLENGKITGTRLQTDRLGFLQQLGVLPRDISRIPVPGKDQVRFIDKFVIPAAAKETFMEKTRINREFIKTLPGFLDDDVYESTGQDGNVHIITIATWENAAALQNAKEKVQEYYKETGFNPAELLKSLNITMDRAVYRKLDQ